MSNMADALPFAYDLHPVVAPVLRGRLLAVFTWLLHSPVGGLVLALLRRKAGVISLRRLEIAAPVTFAPVWPAPTQRDLGEAFTCQQLSGLGPQARANYAAGAAQNDSSEPWNDSRHSCLDQDPRATSLAMQEPQKAGVRATLYASQKPIRVVQLHLRRWLTTYCSALRSQTSKIPL